MKAETFRLSSYKAMQNVCHRISQIEPDGKTQVTISNTGTKSARQRGLFFKWCDEVANSGMGGYWEETKERVHIYAKRKWALPILQRDDKDFAELFDAWMDRKEASHEAIWWFCVTQIHTEKMSTSQNAEILTEMQRHYHSVGIYLTHPDDRGLFS